MRQLQLHFIVILLGFTGILGKLIETDAIRLVWYRMMIAFLGIFLFLVVKRVSLRLPWQRLVPIFGVGLIVGLHWITFFHSIKVSNVSVALGCFASTTLFTSFLEPWIKKRAISRLEVGIGVLIIVGLYVIFRFETQYVEGIIYAIISALLAALFTVINEQLTRQHDARVITAYEMLAGFLGITIYGLIVYPGHLTDPNLSVNDWIWLLILGIVCTSYAFFAILALMRHLTAYHVSLAINLEPVYGILMAAVFFSETEKMTPGFYIGAAVILGSVLLYPVLRKRGVNS